MEERVLILAPRGRDAALAADILARGGIQSTVAHDIAGLVSELRAGAAAALITEEALASGDPTALARWVRDQPSWSDFAFVVLSNGARSPRSTLAGERLALLGNTVLLERPLHAEAILEAVGSAVKARQRQYELRSSAATLEQAVIERTGELAAARDSLAFALDAAGMGSWDMDLVTGIARRCLRHDQIFGYDTLQDEWSVDTFIAHVDPAQRDHVESAFVAALESGSLDIECPITGADGNERWIATQGRVRYDDGGKPVRMMGVVSDITARKEADAQLAQAHKMDAIGQLTGGVAHDFNNLLTPIVGSLDLIRRRHKDDDRTQRMIGNALQAAERAATLTQRLLSFARRQALQPRAVDIGVLIDGMIDLVRRSLGPTIEITFDIGTDLPSARIDPNQLELALLNLAINARDAMPGGGRLTLAAHDVEVGNHDPIGLAPGRYVRLSASDTGVGMDAATLARAAEPFFSTKGVGKGTGLGLSMAHGLAAQSGGALRLDSAPGTGTRVELWLPTTEEEADRGAAASSEPIQARRAANILLVDDEEIVRSATADMLRDIGYHVVDLPSASQALAALRSGLDVDVVVSDYLMPGMTGGGLITEMRAAGFGIPALLVTGYAAAGDDVPADVRRIAKPFRQSDIAAQIDELLV